MLVYVIQFITLYVCMYEGRALRWFMLSDIVGWLGIMGRGRNRGNVSKVYPSWASSIHSKCVYRFDIECTSLSMICVCRMEGLWDGLFFEWHSWVTWDPGRGQNKGKLKSAHHWFHPCIASVHPSVLHSELHFSMIMYYILDRRALRWGMLSDIGWLT